ncbi:RidA family protein [Robertkochia sediminum]|uniref:RidA family protein n=1 Tax=Robertkochia sediminum TaxID=2785326 RepID=UPI0019324A6B|nr:RidA family protein [Robertkochia sediminum]MBL7473607.1 RidA family protein [Robertkochia sediminum]
MIRSITFFIALILLISCKTPSPTTTANDRNYNYDIDEKLKELQIDLPEPSAPVANYVNATRAGNLVFLAGKGPKKADGSYISGKVPTEVSTEQAYEAARLTAIQLLGALKAEIGDLNKVVQVVEVFGMVNATPDYTDHPKVINGCSDLLVDVFGDRGKHARAAVGMGSLPSNISCEIRMTVLVQD